ncbi:transcriptional activator xlnr [Ophiostoma piceae UAMH 11346]|uniref:Transcriptional activator xlnr n=1 Tax=Ophiostoma piceae (strain UAMH 11346) TaxID=1262450 RepID=S3BLY5_OPHP1|nr:transcriptional activator xlnr [Ophiostoma piceae UAMH 11346]
MLSNPLHRFSPYHNNPTTSLLSNTHVPASHMHNAGMDALAQGSHFALQQLQQHVNVHNPHLSRPVHHHQQAKHRQSPYGARSSSAGGPVRRRISRACDQCNQLRTKCDGQHPCAHCIEFGLGCEYIRERKKRGKASRKDLAQQAAAQAAATQSSSSGNGTSADGDADDQTDSKTGILSSSSSNNNGGSTADGSQNGGNVSDNENMMNELVDDTMQRSQRTGSIDSFGDMASDMGSVHQHQPHQQHQQQQQHQSHHLGQHHLDTSAGIDLNGYATTTPVMHNPYDRPPAHHFGVGGVPHTPYGQSQASMSSYPDLPYSALQAHSPTGYSSNGGGFRTAATPLSTYHAMGSAGAGEPASPPWMNMSSSPPPRQQQQQQQQQIPPAQYHHPQNMSAAAAAATAAAHMHSFNGMAMHNLHPAMHPALTGVSASSLLPATASPTRASSSTGSQMPSSYNPAQLRYPVLEPLIPHLATIIPLSLACDLVDLYFSSSSSAQMHPMSPYVLGFIFRKRSFLHPTKPRSCQPALLASMLWVAAQTSDAPLITSVPAARGKICQKLLELTVSLLKPLIHTLPTPSSPPMAGVTLDEQQQQQQQQRQQSESMASPVFGGVTHLGGLGMMPDTISMEAALAHAAAAVEDARAASADDANANISSNSGAFGAAGTVDDVVTYMHLATVVSASEYKGASLRWWNAAWCLARELKLGREVIAHGTIIRQSMEQPHDGKVNLVGLGDDLDLDSEKSVSISEEEREERRRIWWLIYMVDRHLALCYNRPLFLLDLECDGLRRPMDDTAWQNGDFAGSDTSASKTTDSVLRADDEINLDGTVDVSSAAAFESILHSGPSYECSGHNIFGYFLPLMTILGEIVDLHHARNHPRFGLGCGFRSSQEWEAQISEITQHLAVYEQSLKAFEQRTLSPAALIASNEVSAAAAAAAAAATTDASNHVAMGADGQSNLANGRTASAPHDIGTPSVHSVHSVHSMPAAPMSIPTMSALPPRMTELDIQTRIVTAYGTHVMHVLHILLAGKWDPVNLLDDNDLWISSQGFITATGHAVSAAEAISEILDYDPGLEFMPFFFGIYLLQGSFLLLLIADKLQLEASNSVVRACETIIRAHEACVVTLNTEYQRNFSRVMRSALAQARGRVPEDLGEQHMRRRELLSLYRWTGDGTGLAL